MQSTGNDERDNESQKRIEPECKRSWCEMVKRCIDDQSRGCQVYKELAEVLCNSFLD